MKILPKSHARTQSAFWKVQKNFSKGKHLRFTDFSQKTKFTRNIWKCRANMSLLFFLFFLSFFYIREQRLFLAGSETVFELSPVLPLPRGRAPRRRQPQTCRRSDRKRSFVLPARRPRREEKLTTRLFGPISPARFPAHPDCVVFNKRNLRKPCKRDHINFCLISFTGKKV